MTCAYALIGFKQNPASAIWSSDISEAGVWQITKCHTALWSAIQFLSSGFTLVPRPRTRMMVQPAALAARGRGVRAGRSSAGHLALAPVSGSGSGAGADSALPGWRVAAGWAAAPGSLTAWLAHRLAGGPAGWLTGQWRAEQASCKIGLATIVNRLPLLQSNSPILKHLHLCRPARLRHRSTSRSKSNSQNTPKTNLGHRQYGKFASGVWRREGMIGAWWVVWTSTSGDLGGI